ncbi:MAG: hypothetical protein GEV06_26595 [Luteitalea sp.]|nr:hypothetical protein [Luteitalea sp.]
MNSQPCAARHRRCCGCGSCPETPPLCCSRAHAAGVRDGESLPRFVEQPFLDFVPCGWLAGGFARFRCEDCGLDRLVPFSCKSRALCPSCGGRRMAERAAHLVDRVFPDVPVRQWPSAT